MNGWKTPPSKFSKKVKEDHKKLVSVVAIQIHNSLVMRTPVDTGRARSNWLPSVGSPAGGTMPAGDSLSAQLAAAQKFAPKGIPYFPTLYIANNLPYIKKLNEGWSRQAPAHFVEIAIQGVTDGLL